MCGTQNKQSFVIVSLNNTAGEKMNNLNSTVLLNEELQHKHCSNGNASIYQARFTKPSIVKRQWKEMISGNTN